MIEYILYEEYKKALQALHLKDEEYQKYIRRLAAYLNI